MTDSIQQTAGDHVTQIGLARDVFTGAPPTPRPGSAQPMPARLADVLLVTTTEVEATAVFDAFIPSEDLRRFTIDKNTYYDLGTHNGAHVVMVQSEMGAGGVAGAQATITDAIKELEPDSVVMVGVAFGVDSKKQKIGDILISNQLMSYEPQRVGTYEHGGPKGISRGDRVHPSVRLMDRFRSGCLDWPGQKVESGLILSGEKLVDNLRFLQQLLKIEPEAVGGEMQGAGLYAAAQREGVDWLLVKAICNWADGTKSRNEKRRQRLAAKNAAKFALHVIKEGGLAPQSPRPTIQPPPAHSIEPTEHTLSPLHSSMPPPPRLLIGREDVQHDLKLRLGVVGPRNHAPVQILTAIRGWPGVGKTTVAAALAYDQDVKQAFPDGVLWTSLGQKPNLLDELSGWLRALGAKTSDVTSPQDASRMLAELLRDRRMLLIVDDVWNQNDALQFCRGGRECAILVTTRNPDVARDLAPDAASIYRLPELTEQQSLDLLAQLAPDVVKQHPDDCRELTHQLDGLPLALQVAGRLLNAEAASGFDVGTLLKELAKGKRILEANPPLDVMREPTATIAALLRTSTDYLDAKIRWAFACLGVFASKPASFNLVAFQTVCLASVLPGQVPFGQGGPESLLPQTIAIAHILVNRGLMEPAGDERFQLHALLQMHGRSLLDEQALYAASLRHATHYKDVLSTSNDLYQKGGDSVLRGLALFDAEWSNIQTGQAWAAAQLSPTPRSFSANDIAAIQLCAIYPDAGVDVLDLRQHPRYRIRWLTPALQAARQLPDRRMEENHLGCLGLAYVDSGEARHAIEFCEQALVIAREIGDRHNEGRWLGNLGLAYKNLYETRRAIEFYEQHRAIAREIGDQRGEANALMNTGDAYHSLGEFSRAIEFHESALNVFRDIGDRRGEGNALGNLGLAYSELGETHRAIEFYEKQLVITREIRDQRGEGTDLWKMALALDKLGERDKAIACARESLKIREQIEDPHRDMVRKRLAEWTSDTSG